MTNTAALHAEELQFVDIRWNSFPAKVCRILRTAWRATGLVATLFASICDAALVRLVTEPTGAHLARARAHWFHRWSRIALRLLGINVDKQGFTPVSGMIVANHLSLFDAVLLSAIRPCVFVSGKELSSRSLTGLIARLAGTYFVRRNRPHDVARINFMIERAVRRRMLVVIFPQCGDGVRGTSRRFASALLQPAVNLSCTVTGANISYLTSDSSDSLPFKPGSTLWKQVVSVIMQGRLRIRIAFSHPALCIGNRKALAQQLHRDVLRLGLPAVRTER